MDRVPVLAGSLEETDLAELVEVMALLRQLATVEVTSPLGAPEGTLWMKSGHLLDAIAGDLTGVDALRYLVGRRGNYAIFRIEGIVDPATQPLLPNTELTRVMAELKTEGGSLHTTGTQPRGLAGDGARAPSGTEIVPPEVVKPVPLRSEPPPPPPAVAPKPSPSHVAARPQLPVEPTAPPEAKGPVLAVFANKGGVGKTTISVNLSVALVRRGIEVVLVDADPRNDVGNALAARKDTSVGFYDVLDGSASLGDVVLATALPGFSVLPAGGINLSEKAFARASADSDRIVATLVGLSKPGTVVVVDSPPGIRGISYSVLLGSTHALAVVQAEPLGVRSSATVPRVLDRIPATSRPALAGVVLNMFDRRVGASLNMLEEACDIFGPDAVYDIPIPRSGIFIEASANGVPVALMEGGGTTAAYIFESLASHVLERLGLSVPKLSEMRLL